MYTRVLAPALLLVLVLGGMFFAPQLKVKQIKIEGATEVSQAELEELARNSVMGRSFGIFPKDRVFFVPTAEIRDQILRAYPRISDAAVSHVFPNMLSIEIKERAVWGIYCVRQPEQTIDTEPMPPVYEVPTGGCYLADEAGVLFAEAPDIQGSALMRIYAFSTETPTVGMRVLNTQVQKTTQAFIESLESTLSIQVQEILLGNPYNESITLRTAGGWGIFLEKETDTETALQNLALILEKKVADQSRLEYVDLRFANKVFYKVK